MHCLGHAEHAATHTQHTHAHAHTRVHAHARMRALAHSHTHKQTCTRTLYTAYTHTHARTHRVHILTCMLCEADACAAPPTEAAASKAAHAPRAWLAALRSWGCLSSSSGSSCCMADGIQEGSGVEGLAFGWGLSRGRGKQEVGCRHVHAGEGVDFSSSISALVSS